MPFCNKNVTLGEILLPIYKYTHTNVSGQPTNRPIFWSFLFKLRFKFGEVFLTGLDETGFIKLRTQ